MSRFGRLGHRLYTGEISYDFIGHRRRWYLLSSALIAISILALLIRGLVFGIEFTGGADFRANTTVSSQTVPKVEAALAASGVPNLKESTINTIGNNQVRVQTRTLDPTEEVPKVRAAIAQEAGVNSDEVAYSLIGASWGGQITDRALIALVVFLVLVGLVIWGYFRNGKMAAAALVALLHDLILTVGIYALVGFTVTPATLIGVLTILGYSLYDTVVVFDKVRENVRDVRSSTTKTYSDAANLAVNQVLVRSINTTFIGVLPVAALLFAGAFILGEGPLKDLALALFVGMVSGAYSSIFIATPLLAQLKEREPDMRKLASRVAARRAKDEQKSRPAAVAVTVSGGNDDVAEPSNAALATTGAARAGAPDVKISLVDSSAKPPVRPVIEGPSKRPQPQHKPRSQRKK
jgi:preprotein translocase subunit SecF